MSADIIKTWPSFMTPEKVCAVFCHTWARFYFSLGRGKPKKEIAHIWFTHRGRIVGHFDIEQVIQYDGFNLPKLRSISDHESAWQFKPDVFVAICIPPFRWIEEELFHESFRGWRYFDLESYRGSLDAAVNLEAL